MAEKNTGKTSAKKSAQGGSAICDVKKKKDGRGGARPHPEWQLKNMQDGDNARYINHSLKLAMLPKISMQDAEAVTERCFKYFEVCADDDVKPSVAGLALALDVDRTTLWRIREDKNAKESVACNILKKAQKIIEAQTVNYMTDGKMNPIPAIFMLKNHFGYADEQKVIVEPSQPLGAIADETELQQKYLTDVVSSGKRD